jgi:hypothetical protein
MAAAVVACTPPATRPTAGGPPPTAAARLWSHPGGGWREAARLALPPPPQTRVPRGRCFPVAGAARPGMARSGAQGGSSADGLDPAPGWQEAGWDGREGPRTTRYDRPLSSLHTVRIRAPKPYLSRRQAPAVAHCFLSPDDLEATVPVFDALMPNDI